MDDVVLIRDKDEDIRVNLIHKALDMILDGEKPSVELAEGYEHWHLHGGHAELFAYRLLGMEIEAQVWRHQDPHMKLHPMAHI
jgi:hypothetical protein